jgi:hypothetical protein
VTAPERRPGADLTDIHQIIADLAEKQRRLSDYIDACLEGTGKGEGTGGIACPGGQARETRPNPADIVRLLALHGQNASRLGRLLRDCRALAGSASDELDEAIDQVLDELSKELGVKL